MYQRAKVLRAFHEAGLEKSKKQKVKRFLKLLAKTPRISWQDAAKEFREKYYEIIDDIVPPILATGDPLILANLAKCLDLRRTKERGYLKDFVRDADPFENELLFKVFAQQYFRVVGDTLLQKEKLPRSVKTILVSKRRELELTKKKRKQPSPQA